MNITIRCFGVFRQFGEQIALSVSQDARLADLHRALGEAIGRIDPAFNTELIENSRFAHASEILEETAAIEEAMDIVILPPVSGG